MPEYFDNPLEMDKKKNKLGQRHAERKLCEKDLAKVSGGIENPQPPKPITEEDDDFGD